MSERLLVILGCSSQQPTRKRNHGAYLLLWNEEGLLFDPGEGTQRQFIFADIAPPVVTRIFISHFHGDHCLGVGSILMRLNLDKVSHPIHCYFPASGERHFRYLRYGCIYHETIQVIEHPVSKEGVVHDDGKFRIEASFLQHGTDTIGWKVTEADRRKFDKKALSLQGIKGNQVRQLTEQGFLEIEGKKILLSDVSWIRKGDSFVALLDTRPCPSAVSLAKGAKLLLCESTYLEEHKHLAELYQHMTAKEAALLAKEAGVEWLVLTHFSARYQNLLDFEREAKEIFPSSIVAEDLKRIPFPR